MLGLVAAQLKYKLENKELQKGKAIWVDVRCPCYNLSATGLTTGLDWWRHWVSSIPDEVSLIVF